MKNANKPDSSTPNENHSYDFENFQIDPIIRSNEMSFLHESLKDANKKIDEKNIYIEELKSQCEIVTTQISQNWKDCLDDKIAEIYSLKVFFK